MPPARAGSAGRRRVARGPSGRPLAEGQQAAYGPPRAALHQRGAAAGSRAAVRPRSVAAGGGRDAARATRHASANSAEVALRFQLKRRGWPLRTRAQVQRARRARERRPGPRRLSGLSPNSQRPSGPSRPQTTVGRDRLAPTEAAALSSSRPLFFCARKRSDFMTTLGYGPGPEVTASPLTVLEDMEDGALIDAARGAISSLSSGCCAATRACTTPRAPASSCRAATGTTSPGRHASASSRRCAATAAAAARASAVTPPCITRQLSSAVSAARRAKHRQLTEAASERPPSAPGPPCSAARTWSIWLSRVSSCGNSALREQGRHRGAGRALPRPGDAVTRLDERRPRSRSTVTRSCLVSCLRASVESRRACGPDRREQTELVEQELAGGRRSSGHGSDQSGVGLGRRAARRRALRAGTPAWNRRPAAPATRPSARLPQSE
jgi:hypothetical protein